MSDAYAKVLDRTYSIRGQGIPAGTIVHLTTDQLNAAKSSNPPHLEKVAKPEDGTHVVDIRPETSPILAAEMAPPPAPERGKGK